MNARQYWKIEEYYGHVATALASLKNDRDTASIPDWSYVRDNASLFLQSWEECKEDGGRGWVSLEDFLDGGHFAAIQLWNIQDEVWEDRLADLIDNI